MHKIHKDPMPKRAYNKRTLENSANAALNTQVAPVPRVARFGPAFDGGLTQLEWLTVQKRITDLLLSGDPFGPQFRRPLREPGEDLVSYRLHISLAQIKHLNTLRASIADFLARPTPEEIKLAEEYFANQAAREEATMELVALSELPDGCYGIGHPGECDDKNEHCVDYS